MDCRRRLRLGSAAGLLTAAILCGSTIHSQQPPALVFESQPQVAALQCPSQTTTPPATRPAVKDRVPTDEDLATIDIPPPSHAPKLPVDLVERFSLPPHEKRLRVGVWGDSHVAAGFITDEFARLLDAQGIAVDTRMIPSSVGRPGVRLPIRRVCKGGWQFQAGYTAQSVLQLGPSLSNLRSSKAGDYLWIDFRQRPDRHVRRLRIHHLPSRSRAALGIRIDDGPERRVELGNGMIDLRASSSISTMKLRVLQGDVVLQEFELDYDVPAPITIDVFGIPSATVKGWSNAAPSYLKRSIDAASYDAIILEYGTNEGAVGRFDASSYASMLAAALRNVREVNPTSACLLMGPTDRGVRVQSDRRGTRPDFLRYSRIHQQISRIQSEVGSRFGCALWDWQRSMGGPGSIYLWARQTPALAASDLIHLTPAGYRRTAATLAHSLGWTAP